MGSLGQRLEANGLLRSAIQLEKFQYQGIKWIMDREEVSGWKGGILADEMGLGKTVQMLCAMAMHKSPTLVVCPLSTFNSWKDDVQKCFAPDTFQIIDYHKSRKLPDSLPRNSLVLAPWSNIFRCSGRPTIAVYLHAFSFLFL